MPDMSTWRQFEHIDHAKQILRRLEDGLTERGDFTTGEEAWLHVAKLHVELANAWSQRGIDASTGGKQ